MPILVSVSQKMFGLYTGTSSLVCGQHYAGWSVALILTRDPRSCILIAMVVVGKWPKMKTWAGANNISSAAPPGEDAGADHQEDYKNWAWQYRAPPRKG